MQTAFTPEQLEDRETAASHGEIRKCVHCGFCTATCPTYVLLGDERDSPRGRIELIKAMLEDGGAPSAETVKHVDRCLSCLGCKTTCPSGVDYAQLIEHGRAHIQQHYRRPPGEALIRWTLDHVLTRPSHLRVALALGRLARPLEPVLAALKLARLAALLRLTPAKAAPRRAPGVLPAGDEPRGRVILLQGCVENAMAPSIQAAAIRLINRTGFDVVLAKGEGCCGAIPEHLGRTKAAGRLAAANLRAWRKAGPVDAIVTTAAGCGTTLKAYGHRLPGEADAASSAGKARDVLEFIGEVGLPPLIAPRVSLSVAYHVPCSLQHGQRIKDGPAGLLAAAGFEVRPIAEGHLCCGSAGVYNILEPELAGRLRARKAANIERTGAQAVAAANVGCIAQLAPAVGAPVIHPVELLDWATGGPTPEGL